MVTQPTPTRAEFTDVSNAIFEQVDAVKTPKKFHSDRNRILLFLRIQSPISLLAPAGDCQK